MNNSGLEVNIDKVLCCLEGKLSQALDLLHQVDKYNSYILRNVQTRNTFQLGSEVFLLQRLRETQSYNINPLNTDLNPICHLLALLEAHHILHVSRIRVKPVLKLTEGRHVV